MANSATTKSAPGTGSVTDERLLAAQLFNETWRLMEQEHRTIEDDDRMIHAAHASRYHAQRVLDICQDNGIGDWDLAFAFEALARAHAVAGEAGKARYYTDRALAAVANITDEEDRALVLADLETIPGQSRYW